MRKGCALSESTQFPPRARGAPGGCLLSEDAPASPKYCPDDVRPYPNRSSGTGEAEEGGVAVWQLLTGSADQRVRDCPACLKTFPEIKKCVIWVRVLKATHDRSGWKTDLLPANIIIQFPVPDQATQHVAPPPAAVHQIFIWNVWVKTEALRHLLKVCWICGLFPFHWDKAVIVFDYVGDRISRTERLKLPGGYSWGVSSN